jgi:hypothetical protein
MFPLEEVYEKLFGKKGLEIENHTAGALVVKSREMNNRVVAYHRHIEENVHREVIVVKVFGETKPQLYVHNAEDSSFTLFSGATRVTLTQSELEARLAELCQL